MHSRLKIGRASSFYPWKTSLLRIVLIEKDELTAAWLRRVLSQHSAHTVVRYRQWPQLAKWSGTELVVADIGMTLQAQVWQSIQVLADQAIHVLVMSTLPLSQLPKHPDVRWLAKPLTPYALLKETGWLPSFDRHGPQASRSSMKDEGETKEKRRRSGEEV